LQNLPDSNRHHLIQGDICNNELVFQAIKDNQIDTIIHFAAESHVDRSIFTPGQFIQTNIIGTFNLLEAARQLNADASKSIHFHHVSTDEVFGALSPSDPAFNENTPYAPRSPYSASKASSDHLVRAYYHTYGLPVTITNCTNNYGPYQFPEKLIPLMILNAVKGKALPIYGDGKQVRDWLYVEDHCEAIYEVLTRGQNGETYGIGGNNQPANIEIVETICALLDEFIPDSPFTPHASLMKFVTDRPGHDRRYDMDISKINRELGWKPKKTLKTGLYETVKWYLENSDWVESIQKGEDYAGWVKKNYNKR
jgi:dTDP-glucose 4,6-dehydratase